MPNPKNEVCFDHVTLERFLNERLSESEETDVQNHINQCQDCQRALEKTAADRTMWDSLREHMTYTRIPESDQPVDDQRLQRLIEFLGPSEDPEMLGRLGPYEVCGLIGQGSTGIVIKALERRLNRFVAIKVLSPLYSSNGAARKRFEREGKAVASVLHQNVVPIYSVDEYKGLPYIVMQYVAGVSLLQRIEKDGALDTCEVTRIGLQVARGLEAAHEQGIVHRDVKPANVILENNVDRAMVTDFGLARVGDEATMTRSGTIAGTPQYMSPEQAKGESIDPRSDLFSLGSLMYAACTARPPFRAETVFGVINRVCSEDPRPIREINPNIAPWLAEFVNRLIAKRASDRFQTATEVAERLSEELSHLQNPTATPVPTRDWILKPAAKPKPQASSGGRSWGRPWVGWAVAGTLLALAALIFYPGSPLGLALGVSEAKPTKPAEISPLDPGSFTPAPLTGNGKTQPPAPSATQPTRPPIIEEPQITWKQNEESDWATETTFEQKHEQMFPLKEDGELKLDLDNGAVVVRPSELDDRVVVTVLRRVKAGSLEEAKKIMSKNKLDFDADREELSIVSALDEEFAQRDGEEKFSGVLYKISVPRKFNVDINSEKGNVEIGELVGNVSVDAGKGNVKLSRIDGEVFAKSANGDIELEDGCTGNFEALAINGDVYCANVETKARIRTSGGDLWLGGCKGTVRAHIVGGNIKVNEVVGAVDVHTNVGKVWANVLKTPQQQCEFSSNSGEVILNLEHDVAAKLQARGNVNSENVSFEEIEVSQSTDDEDFTSTWSQASLNDGDTLVKTVTNSGSIVIHQFDPPEVDENGNVKQRPGLGGSGLGGSGAACSTKEVAAAARAKTLGDPRPGGIATIELEGNSNIDGYTLYLPVSHAEHKGEYPVLLYLQGAYGVGGEVSDVNLWGLPQLIRDENDLTSERNQLLLDSFIVISLHIQDGDYYDDPKLVKKIVTDVANKYKGDMKRVYVTGLSRGGHGSWVLPDRLPGFFAASVPIGGSPLEVEDFENLADTAVWVAHNVGDANLSFVDVEKATKRIEKEGDVEFLRINKSDASDSDYLDHKHVFTAPNIGGHDAWTDMYTSSELYKWLLKQKLK